MLLLLKHSALCTPLSLPLYIDWIPTATELATNYDQGSYQLSIRSNTPSIFVHAKSTVEEQASAVLREMVYQRLTQGFQILEPSRGSVQTKDRISAAMAKPGQISDMLQQHDFSSGRSVRVSSDAYVWRDADF